MVVIALSAVTYLADLLIAQTAPTQIDAQNATGVQAYNLYSGTRENINLATGNLHVTIPLVTLPGRAGNTLDVALEYDSKIWQFTPYIDGNGDIAEMWGIDRRSAPVGQLGWRLNVPILTSHAQGHIGWAPYGAVTTCTEFIFESSDGSKHSFPNRLNCWYYNEVLKKNVEDTQHEITTGNSEDAEFLTLVGMGNLYTKGGKKILASMFSGATITDSNGNKQSMLPQPPQPLSYTDTLGRSVSPINGNQSVTYVDSNGSTQTISFGFSNITTTPSFPNSGVVVGSATWSLLTSITLPTGRGYTFQYNNFGELTKITYPSGGYTRYEYANYSYLFESWGYPTQGDWPNTDFREVTAKHVCRDTSGNCTPATEDTTTYTPTINGFQSNNQYVDEVDPLGNRTRHQFSAMINSNNRFYSPRETDRWVYQGQSTLLRTVHTDYTGGGTFTNWVLPIRETTTLNDVTPNLVTKTEWDYDTVNGYSYPIDNVIAKREYDYGSGSPPTSPLRQTIATYLKTNSVNGQDYTTTAIHILDRKLTENIQDGAGSNVAKTQYEYDNYGSIAASGAVQHDSTFNTSYTTRGNVTKIQRWRNTDGAWLATTETYDDAGNVLTATAPSNSPYDSYTRTTTFSYADSWANQTCLPSGGNAAAYVTTVTNAKSQAITYKYNSCTGTMASTTDANSQTANFFFDAIGRLLTSNFSDGGQTSYCWSDTTGSPCAASPPLFMTRSDLITSSLTLTRKVTVDGVGHTVQTQLTTDPEGIDYIDISYDALGRRASVSNPHRATSFSTDGTTQYTYDPLNRITLLTHPDGSQVSTSYLGNQTTVTDEAGKKRESQTDGLGRLTTVWEDPNGLNYETDYQYDLLGHLIRVDQKGGDSNSANWRTRTFAFDSLSELLCAAHPEIAIATCPNPDNGSYTAGTIRYAYDNEGNVVTKTSPKPNQTASATVTAAFGYDALNRLTQKSYNDGSTPPVQYGYDGAAPLGCTTAPPTLTDSYPIGRRTSMCDGSGATSWNHENMGRVASEKRTIAAATNITKTISYTPYNLDGSLANLTYPSGRIIAFTPGGAGRPLSAIESAHSINYVTNATYAPPGELYTFANGSSISGAMTYNSRLEPLQLYFTTGTISSGTLAQLQQTACPTTPAMIMSRSYDFGGTNNNSNVQSITDCLNTDRTQNFDYDSLNRLADAYTTGTGTTKTNWGEVYTIDPWANLTNIAMKPGWHNSETLNAATANAQNRLNGFCYDAAGNMTGSTSCPASSFAYDADNQLISSAGYTYRYDGDGKRVVKCSGTYPTCSSGTLYWTGSSTTVLAETDWTGAAVEEYAYFNGRRISRRDGTGNTVHYYFGDQLRSTALITSSTGAIQKASVYYPFGGEIAVTGVNFANNYKFTGKERDAESGLDNFGARHYGSAFARFASVDRLKITGQRMFDPQGWNLYQYTRNTPSVLTDPDGNEWVWGGAENVGNAHSLVFYLALSYMTNARARKNFDTIAMSKTIMMTLRDKDVPRTYRGGVCDHCEGGDVGPQKRSITARDSTGKVTGLSSPVYATTTIDVKFNLGDFPEEAASGRALKNTIQHELIHGVQLNSDPLGYTQAAQKGEGTPAYDALEKAAQEGAGDTSAPDHPMTFSEALWHVLTQLGITLDDLSYSGGVVNVCMFGSCHPDVPSPPKNASDLNN